MKTLGSISLVAAFAFVLGAPALLRPHTAASDATTCLVIVSPHTEEIRYEFSRAFSRWHVERYGSTVEISWRNVGGTSEIARYLQSEFEAAFQNHWKRAHGQPIPLTEWRRPDHYDGRQRELSQRIKGELLDERNGITIGVDLFFGGGSFDHDRCRRQGFSVACPVPEGIVVGIPQKLAGLDLYESSGHWYGTALSSFGIVYNRSVLALPSVNLAEPTHWRDLAAPAFRGLVGLADPRSSGAANKGFEMILQSEMAKRPDDLEAGWTEGFRVIRRMAANARYFTDSASKVPLDVAAGNIAAGMSIDFYGRFQSEYVGNHRIHYVNPTGETVFSPDPISLLRGAPSREVAIRFVEFCLSREGQMLWDLPVGHPGGPAAFSTRRSAIRPDIYAEFGDVLLNGDNPFELAERGLRYREEWTGPLFGILQQLIGAMCIDTHEELLTAWDGVIARPDDEARLAAFDALPVTHKEAMQLAGKLGDPEARMAHRRQWVRFFRGQYERAAAR